MQVKYIWFYTFGFDKNDNILKLFLSKIYLNTAANIIGTGNFLSH